jgi:hypothetical protein
MSSYTPSNKSQQWGEGYIDVATRIVEFRSKFPEGSLRPFNPDQPVTIITIEGKTYLQYVACAYRDPHDAAPGIGVAWEPFPGKTPFTRDSEAMVAETSAWGRAIVATLAADTKKGIASADEIRVANARREAPAKRPQPVEAQDPSPEEREQATSTIDQGWASGEEEKPARANAKQVQRIQIMRQQVPALQDDELYHERLLKAYGVISTKDLTIAQANDLIKKLEKAIEASKA